MASRQFLRRLSPFLRSASRALPLVRSTIHVPRHAVLASQVTPVRCMSTKGTKGTALQVVNIQDEDDFQEKVLQSEKPVVVDFHANWCGPCKLLGPRLEAAVAGEEGRVVMAKVDIDELVEIAMRFNVQSVPTVFGFKDGKMLGSFIGLKDDDEIKSFIQKLL